MSKANFRKRIFIGILSMMLLFSTIISSFSIKVYADSKDRLSDYIGMAADKQTSDFTEDTLSADQLRIIGVFLSNSYIPWNTQINTTDNDDETKKSMVSFLTDSLNFDETIAKNLVETVQGISQSSATELKLGLGKADGTWYDIGNCSYFSFISVHKNEDLVKAGYTKFRLYWTNSNEKTSTVYEGNVNGDYTASTTVMNMIFESLKLETGYGSNILGLSAEEDCVSPTSDTFSELLNKYTTDELYKASCLSWQLYVDAFGNIIVDCGTRQYILMPACMNSFAWTKDGMNAGDSVNLVNLYSLTLSEEGRLVTSDASSYKDKTTVSIKYKSSPDSLWRLVRGDKTTGWSDIKSFLFVEWAEQTDGTKLFDSLLEKYNSGGNCVSEFDISTYWNTTTGLDWSTIKGADTSNVNVIDDFIFFDTVQAFSAANTKTMATSKYGIFSDDKGSSLTSHLSTTGNKFSNVLAAGDCGLNIITGDSAKKYLAGIYTSYCFAYFEEKDAVGGHVNYRFNKDSLPSPGTGTLKISELAMSAESMDRELKSMAYYFLHPTEGVAYVSTWFKNKVSGILVGWHQDMVGNTSANSTTGITKYLGFSGYVTVPNLHDMEWTNYLLNEYDSFYVYIIIIITLIMMGYVLIGSLTFQKAFLGILVFSICAFLPPIMINATINISNSACDNIYSSKFTYWALVQHEQYITDIQSAIKNGEYSDYLLTLFNSQTENNASDSSIVTLKWMCPKKDNYLANIEEELNVSTKSNQMTSLIGGVLSQNLSGEDYTGSAKQLYLYRSYTDIGSYATYSYKALSSSKFKNKMGTPYIDYITSTSGNNLYNVYKTYTSTSNNNSLQSSVNLGFSYNTLSGTNAWDLTCNRRFTAALTSNTVSGAIKNGLDNASLTGFQVAGIEQTNFDTTIADFSNADVSLSEKEIATFAYGIYTESPFYYFSWNLQDQLGSASSEEAGIVDSNFPYKNLFLLGDGDYFYNNVKETEGASGYGEMRDYMDMKSLFTFVIPYLKAANDVVVDWDNANGLWLYPDVDLQYDGSTLLVPDDVKSAGTDSELYYKYWHNANVAQLFNMYTPWVDTMYDCDYAKGQNIEVLGSKFYVEDPLNPSSYYKADTSGEITEGRYMVFSRSEMEYWGLTEADLTTVEQKIINVSKDSYTDLLQLMDYYNFSDDVLNTSAAMMETFNFNKEFSQTSFLSEGYNLYPQCYELKNFSYDAYLRLILSEASGEDLQSSTGESIYTRIVNNSSIFTGIIMIVLDVFAVYAIPALKLFFILAIFFMSILVILSASLQIEINLIKVLSNSLVYPLLKFLCVSVGFAWLISLFMSNGNTSVTNRGGYLISLGDPTMTLLVMIVVNAVIVVLYWRIVRKAAKECVKYAKVVGTSLAGMGGGVLATITGGTIGKVASTIRGKNDVQGINGVSNPTNINTNPKLRSESNRPDTAHRQNKYEKKYLQAEKKTNKFESKQASYDEKIMKGKAKIEKGNNKYNKLKENGTERQIARAENHSSKSNVKLTRMNKKSTGNAIKLNKARSISRVKSMRAGGKKGC
ncbi:G protein-coupled receptor family protein [[Clostridium] fimetarium]|uniref:Uncharacterized protein n=1 Tax=[Clostridium] fimetarium TaxID=99656 RepID=A0A1I0RDC7_9FIRM|nr:hypothetical protein [[Clostridium] fimetarium]SEW38846.1 hypothetical protein SAMN05421659_11450 [[Clostridium] fimetarium]